MRHSADACIGCQYCTWNCSYGVPQYNPSAAWSASATCATGVCRSGRRRRASAPVPKGAIAIEIVERRRVARVGRGDPVERAASGDGSLSTTRVTPPTLPPNATPVDITHVVPEHPHWSLVVMTVLTQLSVGAFATIWLLQLLEGRPRVWESPRSASLLVGGLALAASTLHLGRPIHAYRAIRMWRRSWLSREVLLFGLLGGRGVYAGCCGSAAAGQRRWSAVDRRCSASPA